MNVLAPDEFEPDTTYLNTAAYGLPPARTRAALDAVPADWAAGRHTPMSDENVDRLRASFARLLPGATGADVAIGNSVGALIGPVAAGLPSGAEVLVAERDFASVTNPFRNRADLRLRTVPLEQLAEQVRPDTTLVAVSLAQSAASASWPSTRSPRTPRVPSPPAGTPQPTDGRNSMCPNASPTPPAATTVPPTVSASPCCDPAWTSSTN